MIHPSAEIGKNVSLGHGVVIEANAAIGDRVVLKSGVVVYEGTRIGPDCTVYDHAVLGRPPQGTGALTRKIREDLPPLSIGAGCVIGAGAVLYRGSRIGEQTLIGDLASIREECQVGDNCIVARGVTFNYHAIVGDRVKIMDNTHITGNMIIENGVFIGPLVGTTNENSMDRSSEDEEYEGPTIRRGASVGALASVLPGIEVGEYAVVGSGAVVSHPVPPKKVVLGVPARVVGNVRPEWLPEGVEPASDD